ncbi:MAG TPA: glycosyltransferase family 2 protein, partial [Chloroflexia bacterium]|nr:glycosyltransferase family 2 protein [Chloroflexia bacterium]
MTENSQSNSNSTHQPDGRATLPSISVVIPTYNNLSLLLECLESVQNLDYPRALLEVLVVDNASSDRTPEVIADRFPHVRLVRLESNTGFAPACDRGALEAKGEYVAFLNNDAVVAPDWLTALVAALKAGEEGTVCAASRILSRDGNETEYSGAASNLFGAGRPESVWGWPDLPTPPAAGTPVLFASGGAMLIHRDTFLEVGGFDPEYFAYFEDVDLGWRLWVLGYRVVYAPDAVVRHLGGATGKRTGMHRRYTLWESNSLATIIKNYEGGNMERILSAALLLEYKRALLAAGDAIDPADYLLTSSPDTNASNIERLSKVSVAHLAGVARLNALIPHLIQERTRIQANRRRSDAEILPLLGRAHEPQFAGTVYADAARDLYATLDLYAITTQGSPERVLLVGDAGDLPDLQRLAGRLKDRMLVAVAIVSPGGASSTVQDGYTLHSLPATSRD